jgi:hypothetical protein
MRLDNVNIGTALRSSGIGGKYHNDEGGTLEKQWKASSLVAYESIHLNNRCDNIFHNSCGRILQDQLPKSQRSCI